MYGGNRTARRGFCQQTEIASGLIRVMLLIQLDNRTVFLVVCDPFHFRSQLLWQLLRAATGAVLFVIEGY